MRFLNKYGGGGSILPFGKFAPPVVSTSNLYGYEFDGVDESINAGVAFDFGRTDTFGFSGWIKVSSVSGTDSFFSNQDNSSGGIGIDFYVDSGRLRFVMDSGTGFSVDVSSPVSSVLVDTWYGVGFSSSGSGTAAGVEIYINGVAQTKTVNSDTLASNSISSGTDLFFGASGGTTDFYGGRIDDYQLFNYEPTSANFLDIFNDGFVKAPSLSPISHYKQGDGDTFSSNWTVFDSVGSFDGTSVNMEESDRKLGVAYSLDFDGSNDTIDFGNVLDKTGNDPFSVSFWFKTATPGSVGTIIAKSAGVDGWRVGHISGGLIFVIWGGGGLLTTRTANSSISGNTWHQIVVTYDGLGNNTGVKFYLNGNAMTLVLGTDTFSGSASNALSLFIGSFDNTSNYAPDTIMRLEVYPSELTIGNAMSLYNSGVPIASSEVGLTSEFFVPLIGENDSFSTNWTIVDEISANNGTSINMLEADKTSDTP